MACVFYAYFGYPLILWIGSRFTRHRERRCAEPSLWPEITIILPVYNEQQVIRRTLDRLLAVDYPRDRLHILVISDGSTDDTDDIVLSYASKNVRLVRLPERSGKTAAENAARDHLEGEIVVNTDASVLIDREALKHLIRVFGDPTVGIASGRDVSIGLTDHDANRGEGGYVGYEMWVRSLETKLGGIVGASGCFFASRIELHNEIVPEALSRDFAAPLIAREHGYRAVSVNEAVCYVPRTKSLRREYRRKVRTMTRGLETLYFKRRLLNPFRYGTFAWMLCSHKLARWLVPWAVFAAVVSAVVLGWQVTWFRWVLASGVGMAALAVLGWWWPEEGRAPRFLSGPAYLLSSLVAGLNAWLNALRGDLQAMWEPTRRA